MIKCDLFELSADVSEQNGKSILKYLLFTDLPPQTRAIVTLQRTFLNSRNEKCVWNGFNRAEILVPNIYGDYAGLKEKIDIAESDQIGADWFHEISQSLNEGIATRVSDELTLIVTIGARQRLKGFGRNNTGLSGTMVFDNGGLKFVEEAKMFVVPMADELQPLNDSK